MNLKKVNYLAKLTSKSIESSGLPSDYKKSIAEYIWNGFDAGASIININFESNEIGYLNYFSISDNGSGISNRTQKFHKNFLLLFEKNVGLNPGMSLNIFVPK